MGIPKTYRTPHGLSDELRGFIEQERSLILGTINPDGSPHLTLVLFSLVGGDKVHVPTPHTTRKIKNVRERPTVTALWNAGDGWVSCYGTAVVVEGDQAQRNNAAVRDRLLTESGHATLGKLLAELEDTTIEITPTKWLSWQFGTIMDWFEEKGINLDDHPGPTMKDLTV